MSAIDRRQTEISDTAMPFRIPQQALDNARFSAFPYQVQGQPVFVKHRHRRKSGLVKAAQRCAFSLTRLAFIAPTRQRTLLEEAQTLEKLGALGLPVPQVLHKEQDYFVMSHTGIQLDRVIAAHPERLDKLLQSAIDAIRRLHELDLAHGGAQIKNMTVAGDKLFLIDFEEGYDPNHIEQLKVRDLLLFFHSLERSRHSGDWGALLSAYGGGSQQKTRARFIEEVRKISLLSFLDAPRFARCVPTDAKAFGRMVGALSRFPVE